MKHLCLIVFSLALILPSLCFSGSGPVYVSDPIIPTLSTPVRDLPPVEEDPNLLGLEMHRRDEYGVGPNLQGKPWDNPLVKIQENSPEPSSLESKVFGTPIVNINGYTSGSSPPDTTGDVGPSHFVQGTNGSNSIVHVYDKSGTELTNFLMQDLASGSCTNGYCDPIINYDNIADRWVISEFAGTGSIFCVYVSQTNDPTGAWYAYEIPAGYASVPDYPKYGIWPQDDDNDGTYDEGSYLIGVNAGSGGRDVWALDRDAMLQGFPMTAQQFTLFDLSVYGFELVLPAGHEGEDPPPNNSPAIFMRPGDTEIHGEFSCPSEPCDVMDLWALSVDWNTPSNSDLSQLPNVVISEFDHTLCGTSGNWNCMPQQGTTQQIDPIREPVHFPIQYRNFGSHESFVGCFGVDVDGTDHIAVQWFEIRKVGNSWSLEQDGVVGSDSLHRSVCSAAMDGSGNIAVGYTRTGTMAYPSIYYSGRLSTDPVGTMPQGEYVIQDATSSKTNNERWGDYCGIGVDPVDDCTFWYVTEYGGSGQTKIASFRFDACGCETPGDQTGLTATPNGDNSIYLNWNNGTPAGVTFNVYRSMGSCPQVSWTQIATGLASTSYTDNTVSGGVTYAYYVAAVDITGNCESDPSLCADASTTGACVDPPAFGGIESVTNPGSATCTLSLTWSAGTAWCGGPIQYKIYRFTAPGFTPGAGNLLATTSAISYDDSDALISGDPYYYVVHAVDLSNGVEESNLVELSGVPFGPGGGTQSLFTEDFESAGIPGTWTIVDGSSDSWTWFTDNTGDPEGCGNTDPSAPITGNWAAVDSDCNSVDMDEELITPVIDMITVSSATLMFDHGFDSYGTEVADVDVRSTNTGGSWVNVARCSGADVTSSENIDITAEAAGASDVQIRWHYYNANYEWFWYVDNVEVTGFVSSPCTTGGSCSDPTISGNTTNSCPTTTVDLSTESGNINYQWYLDSNPIGGANSDSYTASASGNYTVYWDDGSGCSGTSAIHTVTITSCEPAVVYHSYEGLIELQGDGDTLLEPGEEWQVGIRLENVGSAQADSVSANFVINAASAETAAITGSPGSYGTIGASNTAAVTFAFCVDGAASCPSTITFDVTGITWSGGGSPPNNQVPAFSLNIGASSNESGTANPAAVSNSTTEDTYSTTFTAPVADTATVDYSYTYSPAAGGAVTLFEDDFDVGITNWTISDRVIVSTGAISCGHSTNHARMRGSNSGTVTYYIEQTTGIDTTAYANVDVVFDYDTDGFDTGEFLRGYYDNGSGWVEFPGSPYNATSWQCDITETVPAAYNGFKVRFEITVGGSNQEYGRVDDVRIEGTGVGGGTWIDDVQVDLVYDPAGAAVTTTLKAAGFDDGGSPVTGVDVAAFYTANGPGAYAIRVTESYGGTADITTSTMNVQYDNCDVSAFCGGVVPGEVINTLWSDAVTLSWNVENDSTDGYNIYRGILGDLPSLMNTNNDSCMRATTVNETVNSVDLSGDDPSGEDGDLYWYLICGENATGEGTIGNGTPGSRTLNSTGNCP